MRAKAGFLATDQLLERFGDNLLLDPFSTLISEGVSIGYGNVLHPGIRICARSGAQVVLGSGNTLFSGTVIEAVDGNITVGDQMKSAMAVSRREPTVPAPKLRSGPTVAIKAARRYLAAVFLATGRNCWGGSWQWIVRSKRVTITVAPIPICGEAC